MKEEIPFNVNNWVKVKLNDFGRLVLREDHSAYVHSLPTKKWTDLDLQYVEPKTDSEGYSKFQMWELFSLFGRYILLGQNLPFDSEIILLK